MDITWYGQSCFKVKGKNVTVVTDPFDPDFTGLKKLKLEADIVTISHQHQDHNNTQVVGGEPFVVEASGEYEVKGVAIHGVSTFHDNKDGRERGKNTIYSIEIDGITICHCGDLGHTLSVSQLEQLEDVDILLVPVGGVYTIGPTEAVEVVSQIAPKVVIPMHYKVEGLKFDLKGVESFMNSYGKGSVEAINKYSVTKDKLPEDGELVLLSM